MYSFVVCLALHILPILAQDCNDLNYPYQYIAYKLQPGEKITFDGKLDEPAWTDVAWTELFQDIQGSSKPKPYFDTRAKMRWDDTYLYLGGYLQETQAWANLTINNSVIFRDSDFEVFIDPNGCNMFYKELELNARNLNWNLLLVRAYLNGGPPVCNLTEPGMCVLSAPEWGVPYWDISPDLPSATYVKGKLNDPTVGSEYWSIEIGIPIRDYLRYEPIPKFPTEGTYWRLDFSRVEWTITVHENPDGSHVYWKVPVPEHNWVWQPTFVDPPNMHVPEYWGYVQFSENSVNGTSIVRDPQWPVRDALMKVYYSLVTYFTANKKYTTSLSVLVAEAELPKYIAIGTCASVPIIRLNDTDGFVVTVTLDNMVGHVKANRFLWFSEQ